jgi:hypothetical protein
MNGEKVKEFARRLRANSYESDFDENGAGTVRDGERSLSVLEDGEIHYSRKDRDFAFRVRDIRDEVDEYMTAYLAAAPDVVKFPKGGKEDTRTLICYAGYELAGRQLSDGSIDFVTWAIASGHRDTGHYFESYASAKEDFALRCGMIDRRKLFSETEMQFIRSSLAELGSIKTDINDDELSAICSMVGRINEIVVPMFVQREDEAEAAGYEPEL